MSTDGNCLPKNYHVILSEHNKQVLWDLHAQAMLLGVGKQFVSAFGEIISRLQKEPLNLGEALYRLPALQVVVFQAVILPLVVDYAVHEDEPRVLIQGFKILS
jgi:hypothetical protein